jgi:hypothetical protein
VSTLPGQPNPPAHILDAAANCFTHEVAARILEVRLDPDIQARVDELGEKANEGALTADERSEYELLIEKADLVGIFKSLARQVLAK